MPTTFSLPKNHSSFNFVQIVLLISFCLGMTNFCATLKAMQQHVTLLMTERKSKINGFFLYFDVALSFWEEKHVLLYGQNFSYSFCEVYPIPKRDFHNTLFLSMELVGIISKIIDMNWLSQLYLRCWICWYIEIWSGWFSNMNDWNTII